ncbi:membrane protein [Gordonia Phage PhinkBoden]|nr:membrane protein [Gordonia Phage PhinkBoden]
MRIDPQQKRLQDALDAEDDKRWELRLAKLMLGVSVLAAVAVITGWVLLIRWGIDGMGDEGVDKGGAVAGGVWGLALLSIGAAAAAGFAGLHWHDQRLSFIKAKRYARNVSLGVV